MNGPINKILVYVDGTESSITAAQYAVVLSRATGAQLSAMYVVNTRALEDLLKARIFIKAEEEEYKRDLEADASRYLNHVRSLARKKGLAVEVVSADLIDVISEKIAQKVGQQRYKIWFKNSTRLMIEDTYVKVGVPNLFIGGWIENHYAEQIRTAVSEVTQKPTQVIFTIDPELFRNQRRRQLDRQADDLAKSPSAIGKNRQGLSDRF